MPVISYHVPEMSSRQRIRAISARVIDVPGVRTIEVDLPARVLRVTGDADPALVRAAIRAAGFAAAGVAAAGFAAATTADGEPRPFRRGEPDPTSTRVDGADAHQGGTQS